MAVQERTAPAGDEAPGGEPARPLGLRQIAARGTLINGAFLIGLNSIQLLKNFFAAGLVATSAFGVWGVLTLGVGMLQMLKDGFGSKYVQQDEPDQRLAFQKAFTLELLANSVLMVVMLAALPLFALVIGEWQIVPPGLVFIATLPALALKSATWIFNREMRFARQRTVEAVDPIVALFATIALAVAGFGYWALVVGYFLGMWAGALVAVYMSPYPVRVAFDRATAREYLSFTWPLLVANGSVMLIPALLIVVGEHTLGLAGAGMMTLAGSIASYADRVDRILTETIYPAICRVKDRLDLLLEAFEKSNRLDLMWGIPFGVGIALFADDLVHFVIGDKWEPGIILIQAFALCSAANHIGFNWTAFLRARGDVRPLAVAGPVVVSVFLTVTLPSLWFWKEEGLAVGMGVMTLVSLAVRAHFIRRLFPAYSIVRQGLRAVLPVVPAAALVLALRVVESGPRSAAMAAGELALFVVVTAAVTVVVERALLREILGYLRGKSKPAFASAG